MASAANSSTGSAWSAFRSQHWFVQGLVWAFALPVPVFLWALQHSTHRAPALAFAAVVTVGCLGIPLAAASSPRPIGSPVAAERDATTSTTSTTTTELAEPVVTTAPAPTTSETTAPPTTAPAPPTDRAAEAATLLSQVRVADEAADDGYDRSLFNHWGDADGDGCNTRCEVLRNERLDSLPGLPNGGWLSLYDGFLTDDPADLDIDHLVALGEAWRSGAWAWDARRRAAFANDLDDPRSLIAVSASSNRSKSDSDPSGWRPPNEDHWCQYVTDWMAVKLRWDLAVDPIEFTALQYLTTTSC